MVVPLFAVQVPQPTTVHGLTLSASDGIATQAKSAARMMLRISAPAGRSGPQSPKAYGQGATYLLVAIACNSAADLLRAR